MTAPAPWQNAYDEWNQQPTPDRLHGVVRALQPAITQHLYRYGAQDDPLLKAKARVLAAQAVRTWKPSAETSLPTWTGQQMIQLQRFRRNNSMALHVPEGIQLDAHKADQAKKSFMDVHDREPDQHESADAAGLSMKRLKAVQLGMRPMPSESAFDGGIAASSTDYPVEAIDMVYNEANKVDRAIMEGRMGYNGASTLATPQLLQKTKLSPFQLARRVTGLTSRISRVMQDLEEVYAKS